MQEKAIASTAQRQEPKTLDSFLFVADFLHDPGHTCENSVPFLLCFYSRICLYWGCVTRAN